MPRCQRFFVRVLASCSRKRKNRLIAEFSAPPQGCKTARKTTVIFGVRINEPRRPGWREAGFVSLWLSHHLFVAALWTRSCRNFFVGWEKPPFFISTLLAFEPTVCHCVLTSFYSYGVCAILWMRAERFSRIQKRLPYYV